MIKVDRGTNVAVSATDVDRERVAPRNVLVVLIRIHSSGLYN